MYDFKGEELREEHIDNFKQLQWRPRPPTLLTKEEQKQIRKNLREYSRVFEQEDAERINSADVAVVEHRRRLLQEWWAWRASVEEEVSEERTALGLPSDPVAELLMAKTATIGDEEENVVEEVIEEILEELEEVVS